MSACCQVALCTECIEWAQKENRTFLRQALEARLIALYFDTKEYNQALQLGSTLAHFIVDSLMKSLYFSLFVIITTNIKLNEHVCDVEIVVIFVNICFWLVVKRNL